MNPLGALLGKPIGGLLSGIGGIIDKFVTTDKEKLEAKAQIALIELDFQKAMIDADAKFAASQAEVIMSEAKGESWLQRNWRPLVMLMFAYIVAHTFILAPIFHLEAIPMPDRLWDMLELGMGGYIIGRSAEKTLPRLVEIVTEAKKK